jgi:hypothetical protein
MVGALAVLFFLLGTAMRVRVARERETREEAARKPNTNSDSPKN